MAKVSVDGERTACCEFCGRCERWNFFGLHRQLCRVAFRTSGAVICADCLNSNGELLNRAIRG